MALSTLKIEGKIEESFKTVIQASREIIIDQPKAMGGNDEGPNPLEYFLSSIAGCMCAIGKIIQKQKRLDIKSIKVFVEGDLDKDFLMGKTKEGRAGFVEIRTKVDIDSDMSLEEKEKFVEEIEKRCPVADNIAKVSLMKTTVK